MGALTHAWLLWAMIGAAGRVEGRGNERNSVRVVGGACRESGL